MKPLLALLSGLVLLSLLLASCAKDDLEGLDNKATYTLRTQDPSLDYAPGHGQSDARENDNNAGKTGIDPDKDEEDDDDDDYIISTREKSKTIDPVKDSQL
jgi:hypothetical protein